MVLRVLELFSGSGSVGNVLQEKLNAQVVSIDIHPAYNPTTCVDILKWNYKVYKPGHFKLIWASPPCTEYSLAKTVGERNLKLADAIVKRTLQIIKYLKPKFWFIENPLGMLYKRNFMKNFENSLNVCSYCKYGLAYRKPTHIWSNASLHLKHCTKDTPCSVRRRTGCHSTTAQHGSHNDQSGSKTGQAVYGIPRPLVLSILKSIT